MPRFRGGKPETECTHPGNSFRIRRDYPWWIHPDEILEGKRPLVIFGHCNNCGYDAPAFDIKRSDIEAFYSLKFGEDKDEYIAAAIKLLQAGKLFHSLYPTDEQEANLLRSMTFEQLGGAYGREQINKPQEWAN